MRYEKAQKYADLATIYAACSGLELAEFLAEKLQLQPGHWLLDIGIERGYQTCFLANEYGGLAVKVSSPRVVYLSWTASLPS
jgi:hypothetical protein